MKAIIPLYMIKGKKEYVVYPHFGRAEYFGIVDVDSKGTVKKEIIKNPFLNGEQLIYGHNVKDFIMSKKPDMLVVTSIGDGAYYDLKAAGVKIVKPRKKVFEDVIEEIKEENMEPFTTPHKSEEHMRGVGGGNDMGTGHFGGFHHHGDEAYSEANDIITFTGAKDNESVLDLGCGDGFYTKMFRKLTSNVTGVDLNDASFGDLASADIKAIKGDICSFKEGSYDLVFISNVLHGLLINKNCKLLQNLKGLVKGRLVVLDFKLDAPFGPSKEIRIPPEEMARTIEQSGFKLVDKKELKYHYMLKFEKTK